MQTICANRKLLLGLFLLFLSDKVMCRVLSSHEEYLIRSPLKLMFEGYFYNEIKCSTNTMNEVRNCMVQIFEEGANNVYGNCTVLKSLADCQKVGLLNCEDGQNVWLVIASALNRHADSMRCPPIYDFRHEAEIKIDLSAWVGGSSPIGFLVSLMGIMYMLTEIFGRIALERRYAEEKNSESKQSTIENHMKN